MDLRKDSLNCKRKLVVVLLDCYQI